MSSGLRWADADSSSESDEEENDMNFVQIPQTTKRVFPDDRQVAATAAVRLDSSRNNADEIKSTQVGKFGNIALYTSDEESEEEADSESLDETDEAICRYSRNEDAEKESQEKKALSLTKIPLKKEKEQMKSKDLDDLDDILNEFGIDVQPAKDNSNPEPAEVMISTNELEDEEEKSGKKKKKKKKKKQSDTADNTTDDALVEAPADDGDVPSLTTNSVAAVIKAKAPAKKKSPAEIAAATAAKEAKAKKETEIKKKKKRKDKFLHGGVQR